MRASSAEGTCSRLTLEFEDHGPETVTVEVLGWSDAVDDYQRVPARVPAVLGHYGDVGHTGMFTDPDVEREIVGVAAQWLDATLFDDAAARPQFVGWNCGLCSGTEWDMASKNW